MSRKGKYGVLNFVFDVIMTLIFNIFWLMWIFIREMRRRG